MPYLDILVNAFFSSQFNYCPLIWMCHNRMLNNRINRLHERSLRIIYNDKHTSFEELLEKDKSVSTPKEFTSTGNGDVQNISENLSRDYARYYFKISDIIIPKVKSVNFGFESIRI